MAKTRKLTALFAIVLLLASCAGNTLRIEGADAVAVSADRFVTSANAALDDAKAKRAQANATLIASDVSCEPADRVNLYVPNGSSRRARGKAPLCARGSTPRLGYDLLAIDLRPIPEEALKPTVKLIGALGDYGAALAKITKRPKTDVSAEIARIEAKAQEASDLANGLLHLGIPSLDSVLNSKQRDAAAALLQFAVGLAEEQRKVDDIRKYVAEHGAEVDALIPQLREQLAIWVRDYAQGDAQIVENNLRRAYRDSRAGWDFDRRLSMVQTIAAARTDAGAYEARLAALNKGLDAFAAAQLDLRRLLRGEFNAKERRRIANLDQQRMLEALGLMARAIIAFGGL
jgi:hypothetical protein